ncbi:unnamed protein product [Vitrella brassicaformis CCMP3155]|uniref:EF-hand domain-containing protein n=1 Tax=Vitrella brassicaformis (strain CCMP3155) TaxID=1169540 RepID=A0A0G4GUE0_VITBC|nr:unnamed protein product [Vitrella brassicaformis CCMP3155]|eukprot:CEM34427.1 unnamed protein product [Vitrella brassicaformis CCMP3155]
MASEGPGPLPPGPGMEDERSLVIQVVKGQLMPSKNSYIPTLKENRAESPPTAVLKPQEAPSAAPVAAAPGELSADVSPVSRAARVSLPSVGGVSGAPTVRSIDTDEVMLWLDAASLHAVKKGFESQGGVLTLPEFLELVLTQLSPPSSSDIDPRMIQPSKGQAGVARGSPKHWQQPQTSDEHRRRTPEFTDEEIELLTAAIIETFRVVDMNGDGKLTWEELSNYIIELGMIGK